MLDLVAYTVSDESIRLATGEREREWWPAFARRCLPMLVANQNGWAITATEWIEAGWDGEAHPTNVWCSHPLGSGHFGSGILTFNLPYLFRTPPGWNLIARGAPNFILDGIQPLEGLVETDWAVATFTMNWKFTRPGKVMWKPDDPVCFIQPQERGTVERFRPVIQHISADPALADQHAAWGQSRGAFNADPQRGDGWQRHYVQGVSPGGAKPVNGHQTRIRPHAPERVP